MSYAPGRVPISSLILSIGLERSLGNSTHVAKQRPKGIHLMQTFSPSPQAIPHSLWQNRGLIKAAVVREVAARYKGSVMGIFWSFLIPILMLLIYTFVFSEVFKARWGNGGSRAEFALVLLIGLIVFNLFSECVNRAPSIIVNNPNYVKKVIFPLEVLPCVALGSSLFHALVSLFVWIVAYMILAGTPHYTILITPLILFPFGLFIVGISWFLASLGVYLRDVGQAIGVLITAAMFLSPIFYPATAIPEDYRFLLYLNPITLVVEQARDVLYWGKLPDFGSLARYYAVATVVACLGFAWFQKTRKGFADVL